MAQKNSQAWINAKAQFHTLMQSKTLWTAAGLLFLVYICAGFLDAAVLLPDGHAQTLPAIHRHADPAGRRLRNCGRVHLAVHVQEVEPADAALHQHHHQHAGHDAATCSIARPRPPRSSKARTA